MTKKMALSTAFCSGSLAVLCLVGLILSFPGSASASWSVPAFVWSNTGFVQSSSSSLEYQTISFEKLISDLFGALKGQSKEELSQNTVFSATVGEKPDLVLAFVGKELNSQHLAQYGEDEELTANPLSSIKTALDDATSSRVLPYITSETSKTQESVTAQLLNVFRENFPEGQAVIVGDCQITPAGGRTLKAVDDVKAYLEERAVKKLEGQTDLLLMCAPSTEADAERDLLLREGGLFSSAYSSIQEFGVKHVVLYTSDPKESIGARRIVLDTDTTAVTYNRTCDDSCLTRSLMLETLAVVIVLLITLISGLCCLGAVDSPTRFEAPRDS